jgi:hypothetical protein
MAVGPGNNPHTTHGRKEREELVRTLKDELIRQAFREEFDVIVDDTHLVPLVVKKLHGLAQSVGDVTVIEKGVNVSVDECIRRDALRTGWSKVGADIIKGMAKGAGLDRGRKLSDKTTYYAPRWSPGGPGASLTLAVQDQTLPKAIICDLDGTARDMNGRNPFDASTCDKDLPIVPVLEFLKAMHAQDVKIIFVSGCYDTYKEPTSRWMDEHLTKTVNVPCGGGRDLPESVTIPYDLHMRPAGDQRKDTIFKREVFDLHVAGKYNVLCVLEDRNQVVDMWREMGLMCWQVQPGNF